MTDVARRAQVSYQTVSRVLNAPDKVRPETARRVREAIEELGFAPNRAARALRTSRSGMIGVITSSSPLLGPMSMLYAIEEAARDSGYTTIVSAVDDAPETTVHASARMIEQGVDGIIVIAPYVALTSAITRIGESLPVISVGPASTESPTWRTVRIDQRQGAWDVIEHLAARGCRSVLHVRGPSDWFDARERARGAEEACEAHGLRSEMSGPLPWSARAGYEEVSRRVADRRVLPDAIFAASDALALGALRALTEARIGVPDVVALVGFDAIEVGAYSCPALTTVRQPFDEAGHAAVRALLEVDDAPAAPLVLRPQLVVRETA